MQCQFCARPATIHLTNILNKKKHEVHLCEVCAREHHLITQPDQQIHVPALLQLLVPTITSATAGLTCPCCGMTFAEFRTSERLGCPHDYEAFRPALEPLLERLQYRLQHLGKAPRRARQEAERNQQLFGLRQELQKAIAREAYEEAARLRDQIRQKEATDEPG